MSAFCKRRRVGFDNGMIEAFEARMSENDRVTQIDLRG